MGEKREIPLAEVMLEGACEYISVQSMEIYTAADTHARAIVSILVDGAISESVCQSAEEQLIKLKLSDGTILFQGYCEECDVKVQNQYKEVTLWALSGSHEADKEKKSRTFQNPSKTLGSILTSVLEEHSIIARIEGDLTIPHIVSQNKETDWEFCVRLANQYQKAVWTDSRTDKVTAHIGNISFGDEEIGADAKLVKTSKEFNDYRSVLANGNTPNPGYQYIYRNMISHNAVIIAGDMTEKGLVTATRLTTNKGVLDNQITIQNARQKAPDYRIQTKDAFTSKILTGKVIGVTSSTVQIEFDVDGQQDKAEAIELPYESILSNSFYNMPDENDKVFVYMDNQGKAVCLGSKRTDTVDEYFLNPKEKAIGALDRVVHFTEKALVLSATRQLYSQESEEQVTLTLDGEQGISVEALGTIKLSSENEIMIAASIKSIEEIKGSKSLSIDNNYKAKKKLFDAYLEAGGTVSETRARFNKWASDAGDNLLNGLKDMVFWDAWHKADTVELDSETDTYESGNCILRGISIELSVGEVTIRMGMEETPSVLYAYASVYSWLGTEPNENYPQKVDELRDAWEIGLDLLTAGLAIAGTVCLIVGTGGAAAGVLLAAGAALGFARQDYFSGITSLVGCVGAFAKIGQLPAWMTRIGDAVKNISVVAKLRDLATANRSMLAMCQLVYGFGVLVYTVYKTIPQTKERMDNQDTFLGKACEFAIGLLNISNAAISTADTMNNASDTILSGDPVDPIVSHDAGGDNINSTSQIESVTAGDPVDVVSGALIIPFTDIIIPDIIGDFRLVRTYRSVYENKGGMLGSRWLYNIESRIAVSGTCITVLLPDIHKETFICVNGKWQNKTEGRERYILTKSDTGFCLKDSETRETYIYDGEGRIKCKEDRNHNRMEYFYQGNCLEKLVFASGQALYFSYENEKISKICDTAGRECRFWYDGELLTGVQGTNGGKVSYTYTKEGYISRITNENGKCYVTNQYDRKGRVVCQNTADGEEYVFFYDDVNRRTTFTTVSKNTSVTYHYNAKNLVEKTVFEDGNIRERKYDACERVIYERDELNREIFREYDSAGRLLQEKFPTGLSTTYQYDANGNMIEKKDNLGRVTRYEYDDRGNRVYAAYLLDKEHWAENRMTYDVHGRILSFTDAQGNTRTWEYSKPFAQATRSVGAEGETVVCELDEFGRRMAVRSERGTVELSYNMLNFITSVTDEEGNTTCSKYDLTGKRIALIRPNEIDKQHGVSTNYEYDAMDHLIKTINPCGDVMAVQVDSDGRITKEINPNAFDETCEDGDGIEYKYDTRGYLIQVRYPDGGIKCIIRDACGNITKIIKPEEYARAGEHAEGFLYEYDNGNRLVRVRDEQGSVRKCYIYDVAGRVTKEIDAKGYLAAQTDEERIGKLYFYNKTGWLMEKREPIFQNQDGSYMYRLFNYRYDDCGRLIEEKKYLDAQTKESSKGRVLIIRREYDRSGRLKRVSDSTGANAEYTYNEHGQVLTEKVRISENVYKRKKYSYYKNGRLSCVATSTDKKGTTRPFAETHFSYDKNGNLTAIKTPAGHEIRREYDAADRLIREIHTQAYDKVTNETKFGYDRSGNLITITDNDGNISGKSYDMMNRLVMEIAKDGGVNATKYNLDGKIIKRIKPNSFQKQGFEGDGTSYCYDRQGRITQETNAEGNIVKRLYYNCYGEVQSIRDIDDVQIDFGYDYAGRRTSVITGTGVSRQTEYDINGKVTSVTDGVGNKTYYELDEWGRVSAIHKADGSIENYDYDYAGNVIRAIDGEGHEKRYEYNELNKLAVYIDSAGMMETWTYDAEGNIASHTDRNGVTLQYSYNMYGSMTRCINKASGYQENWTYHCNGLPAYADCNGRRYEYDFDCMGRLKRKSSSGRTLIGYDYDLNGNKVAMSDYSGKRISYQYDAMDRLTQVTDGNLVLAGYTYNIDGSIRSLTIGNDVITEYTYDENRNLSGLRTSVGTSDNYDRLIENTYTYDANGNMLTKQTLSGLTEYTYNEVNAIVKVQYPGETEELYYDKAGNRNRRVINGEETIYEYDSCNRLMDIRNQNGELLTEYAYDRQGNLLCDDKAEYTFDDRNRVVKAENFDGNVQINRYNAEGLRDEMEENGRLIRFVFDGGRVVTEETQEDTIHYITANRRLIASDSEKAKTYYHYASDELGSITHVADEEGNVLNRYEYDAFGNMAKCEENIHNRFRYCGEQYDAVTQQYYLRARFYNPVIGRFIQEDIYHGDGLNLYTYCQNNPVYYIDPSGHAVRAAAEQNYINRGVEAMNNHIDEAVDAMSGQVYGDSPTGPVPTDPTPNPSYLDSIEDFYNGIYEQQYDFDNTNMQYESYLNDLSQVYATENYTGGGSATKGYSNFADGMSPEDAARYIANNEKAFFNEFAERASAAGLNSRQIEAAFSAMRSGDYAKMASYFDTSSPVNGAVFWSGNKEGAAAYANSIGGTIMEQTPGGQVFDNWRGLQGMYPEWDTVTDLNQKPIWDALSSQYANGAEGMATYVHPSGYEGKVWLNIEKPILEENDIIIQEVIIDAK